MNPAAKRFLREEKTREVEDLGGFSPRFVSANDGVPKAACWFFMVFSGTSRPHTMTPEC